MYHSLTHFYLLCLILQMRGAVFFIIAVIILLLFDHDEKLDQLGDHDCIFLPIFIIYSFSHSYVCQIEN